MSDNCGIDEPWIEWFCSQKRNQFLCKVDKKWIRNEYNLIGFRKHIPHYTQAMEIILDGEDWPIENAMLQDQIEQETKLLYGLMHARYILSPDGLHIMHGYYDSKVFGKCPRVSCKGSALLPIGESDTIGEATVKLYCAKCDEIFNPTTDEHGLMDGVFFGTNFPSVFFMTYPELKPADTKEKRATRLYAFRHPNEYEFQGDAAGPSNRRSH